MPTFEYIYMDRPRTKLYGNVKAGVAIIHMEEKYDANRDDNSSSNTSTVGYQVNPIGFRYGRDIGGFIELGMGFQSIVSFGFSAKF